MDLLVNHLSDLVTLLLKCFLSCVEQNLHPYNGLHCDLSLCWPSLLVLSPLLSLLFHTRLTGCFLRILITFLHWDLCICCFFSWKYYSNMVSSCDHLLFRHHHLKEACIQAPYFKWTPLIVPLHCFHSTHHCRIDYLLLWNSSKVSYCFTRS